MEQSNEMDNMMVCKIMNYLTTNNMAFDFVKNFNEPCGFAWTSNPLLYTILDNTDPDGNTSPNVFALYLRLCQSKLNETNQENEQS